MSVHQLHRVAVIGGGMMGRSIATRVAQAGLEVVVNEVSKERAAEVKGILEDALTLEIDRWSLTQSERKAILSRMTFASSHEASSGCGIVVETITEDFAAKKALLAELDALTDPGIPIIVNTSTLSVTELAGGLAHPERVLGMHFLYPATTTRGVEVVRGQVTADEPFAQAIAFARLLGKIPIEEFESPGFVVTRVMMPLVNEAAQVVMEGVASAAQVDLALKLGFDSRVGALEWADRIGLQKMLTWLDYLFRETGDPKFRPCPLLRKLVRAGHLGTHTGRGFFTYDGDGNRTDRLADDGPSLG
jgi:3-hydroxybutyryl-CoA dehydrogenase